MNIHEYQAKELLKARGVPVPECKVAYTVDEAVTAAGGAGAARRAVLPMLESSAISGPYAGGAAHAGNPARAGHSPDG